MIGIKIEDDFLNMDSNTSMNITEVNPMFDNENIKRAFSYPFKIPDTALNKRKLKQLDRLDSTSTNLKLDAELWILGVPVESGFVKVTGNGSDYIQIRFENKEQDMLDTLESIKINDILETVEVPWTGNAFAIFEYFKNGSGEFIGLYRIQIDQNIYFKPQSLPTTGTEVSDYFKNEINADYPGFADSSTGDELHLEIALYPDAVIQYDGTLQLTWTSALDIVEDKRQSFHDFVDANILDASADYAFPVIKNKSFYDVSNTEFQEYINFWSDGSFINNTAHDEEVWEHTFVPLVKLKYIFSKIIDQVSSITSISGTFYNLADTQNLLIYNNVALDEVTYADYTGTLQYFNHYKQSFDLNDHVPEITAKAFLFTFLKGFKLFGVIESGVLNIYKKTDQISLPAIDWTHKANAKYTGQVNEKKGFLISLSEDANDLNTSSTQLQPYTVGLGGIPVTVPFGTLVEESDFATYPTSHSWKIPVAIQKGTSSAGKLGKNNYTFRLLLYRGLQDDSNNNSYPMAQNSSTDYAGTEIGSYSLDIDGDKGLYDESYKNIIEMEEADVISMLMTLNISDILTLKKWKNSKRKIFTEKGEFIALVKSFQFKVDMSGISQVKVDMVKI